MYRGGLAYMRYSISDTAEWGDYITGPKIVTDETLATMKKILADIQDGTFAKRWIEENETGRKDFEAYRKAESGLLLRDMITLAGNDESPALILFDRPSDADAYVLPTELTYAAERDWSLPALRAAFARARSGSREGLLFDAASDDRLWQDLFSALTDGRSFAGTRGTLQCEPTWSLESLVPGDQYTVRRAQSGSRQVTAVIDETVRMTLFHRTVDGVHPAIELALRLHDANYTHTPPLLGTFRYRTDDGHEIALGLARREILAQGNAWTVLYTMLMRSLAGRRPLMQPEGRRAH